MERNVYFLRNGIRAKNILTKKKNKSSFLLKEKICAEVAELVDALGSGSSVGGHVGVRVPSSAPGIRKSCNFKKLQLFRFLVK